MKRLFLTIAACFLLLPFALESNAQETSFKKGTGIWNLGVGLNNAYSTLPPLSASFAYSISDYVWDSRSALGMGGIVAIAGNSYTTSILAAPRISLHYSFIPKLDTYVAGYAGVRFQSIKTEANETKHRNAFDYGFNVGTRYFFTPMFGAFLELGYGVSYGNIGVSLRL
ncbi:MULTISPECIES: hypothetical protein [Porphyromonas]|uniref:Outer membrane protein beta-barrel domain-containing protein n=1 Tax=Porphyromonas canoris TaxID=36875 RepID=A0ABR4XJ14_9PORP|nr:MULTISPECIES: hypothetical protein [Porphyromonas]KGL52708.1 hypothetical protein HQ29_03375 [Porphyromonas canoris]KGN67852.1 hypothetical protein JT26_07885 [Porphyromonas sp. COT-108 OH1349]KGN91688.1 hypothetical protein HQ43_06215 [Porphyromonas canoris]KGN95730.1 hypothetical protein HQ39_05730 [Porphyromonas sp. COT-108 OH2963]